MDIQQQKRYELLSQNHLNSPPDNITHQQLKDYFRQFINTH